MRVNTLLKFTAPVLLIMSVTANAASIVGSDHDLSSQNATTDQVCIFCHTPHNARSPANVALWNRDDSVATFTMYDSPTINMTIQNQPEGVSAACLSCHDGTIALDAMINTPPNFTAGTAKMTGGALLSNDLSNDHPISVVYDSTQDASGFVPTANVAAALPLFTGTGVNQVECGTCHNVHDNAIAPFLRISNAASALCTTCHTK